MTTETAPSKSADFLGTGRRKSSVARVRLRPGTGKVTINNRDLSEYFNNLQHRNDVVAPLMATGKREVIDITVRVCGGGITGQAGACKLGIARALRKFDAETYEPLKNEGLLTRDSRMTERKKYGLHKARKATQFSKR